MNIEITIPVLNEELTLEEKVTEALMYLRKKPIEKFSLIIADNGSTDRTEEIARKLERKYEEIEYLKVERRGVGLALQTSWMRSNADVVGYMDLDLATDLKHVIEVYDLFKNDPAIQIVNGSRLLSNSEVINRTLIREITSRTFNILVKLLLGTKFTDGMCGFKFFNRKAAQDLINTGIRTEGWIFSTEMLVKAEWKGIEIIELPVRWVDDQNSKVKIIKLSYNYFKHLLKLRREKKHWIQKFSMETSS